MLFTGCVVHDNVNIVQTHAQVFGYAVKSLHDETFKLGSCHAGKCSRKGIGRARKSAGMCVLLEYVNALVIAGDRLLGGTLS